MRKRHFFHSKSASMNQRLAWWSSDVNGVRTITQFSPQKLRQMRFSLFLLVFSLVFFSHLHIE